MKTQHTSSIHIIASIACVLWLLFPASETEAQSVSVWKSIYDFELSSAQDQMLHSRSNHKDEAWLELQRSNVYWWKILLEFSDVEDDQSFLKHLTNAESLLSNRDELSDNEHFLEVLIKAYRARYHLLQGNYLSGINQLNQCLDNITASFGKEERYPAFYLTSGLYYYFIGLAHQSYPLLRPYLFFMPEGDMEKGIAFLKLATYDQDLYVKTEATYFLMRIHFDITKDWSLAKQYLTQLKAEFPNHPLFQLYAVKIARETSAKDEAAKQEETYRRLILANSELSARNRDRLISLLDEEEP